MMVHALFCVRDPIFINLDYDMDDGFVHSNNGDSNDFDDMYELIVVNHDLSSNFQKH